MLRRPPRSTLFPTRRSSDLEAIGIYRRAAVVSPDDPGIQHKLAMLVPADRKSTRLNSSHSSTSYAVFCLKKKNVYFCPSLTALDLTGKHTSVFACLIYIYAP